MADFKVGDSVKYSRYSLTAEDPKISDAGGTPLVLGKTYKILELNHSSNHLYLIVDSPSSRGMTKSMPISHLCFTLEDKPNPQHLKPLKCECGAHKLGYQEGPSHYPWCSFYKKF